MRVLKNIILLVAIVLGVGGMSLQAKASEVEELFVEVPTIETIYEENGMNESNSRAVTSSLDQCELGVGIYSNGLGITFTTRSTDIASEIGVKNLVLYEKKLIGWKEIPVSNYCAYNSRSYTNTVVYTGAVAGKTYKASCTHYAIINGVEYTLGNETSEIVYN